MEEQAASFFMVDPEGGGSIFSRNIGIHVQNYAVSHHRSSQSDESPSLK
jgi:hypothetical protein